MKDNRIELADVVRRFKDDYVARFGHLMMPSQKKALADIAACMTAEMGGHQYQCRDCDNRFWVYHGCRNRACPACHGRRMRDWLQARQAELLPCDYYHMVATVPEEVWLFASRSRRDKPLGRRASRPVWWGWECVALDELRFEE